MRLNHYPLWKNLLLLALIFLGFLYALPNIFGDYPVVQISGKNNLDIHPQTRENIKTVLKENHLAYQKISLKNNNIFIHFYDTDTQLKARDMIKNSLGNDYIVALNLASASPDGLNAIGAWPMKLGLDLRGGVHFLLNVDIDSMITHRQQGNLSNILSALRSQKIRYADATLAKNNHIFLSFNTEDQKKQALLYLTAQFPELVLTTDNLSAESIEVYLKPAILAQIRQSTLDQTMVTLRNRVNELGISEAIVQQQGINRVSVDLPGVQDTAHAKEILGGTATLAFRLVDVSHDAQNAENTGMRPIGSTLYHWNGKNILLNNQVVLTGASITDASTSFDETGRPAVTIRLGGGGESLFHRITANNIGNPMAVVYLETAVDYQMINHQQVKILKKTERIINVATIQSALGNSFQITGLSSPQEAKNLSLFLRAGALPVSIHYEAERTVGPTLGQENIHKGLLSVIVAMSLVMFFMAIYYSVFGLIADMALLINVVLLVALLSVLGATLTLPGIAGIVLTLGMAVDANVLIFERIREELRLGNTPQASIYAGYERAFTTIVDANVTTLIVAMVLFSIGTDAIKGFAVTLTLGLFTSMVSGIMVTRAIVNQVYGTRQHLKKLPIGL